LSLPDTLPRAQPPPRDIAAAIAQAAGQLGRFGHQVEWYDAVTSTNDVAAARAGLGAPEGFIVMADAQTAGRGRRGRTWCSPPGAGLYVSVVLRPEARTLPLVTLMAGVALVDGIRAATGLVTTLKWPNDVMGAAVRKLAGILAEAGPVGAAGQGCHCVLGFGVNLLPAAYPPGVAARATSLEEEIGSSVDRGRVFAQCVAALAARYDELRSGGTAAIVNAWRVYARPLLGRTVEWDERGSVRQGAAEDVDESGALLVRTSEGTVRVISGEVRWT
jgi:BirA family transcriptional regulator, biotin operon repressor / biotin---[acetyl-CoA-carboxylase] ligase